MAEKKKRVSLTLKQKVNAIREVENNSTKSKGKIAEDLNIPRTTLMNILKNKAKYKEQFESGRVNLNMKKDRPSDFDVVDEALLHLLL